MYVFLPELVFGKNIHINYNKIDYQIYRLRIMKNRDNKALNKLSDWFPFDGFFNLRQK